MSGSVGVIIPAAGLGRRFGGRTRKPFAKIGGHPLLAYTLMPFQKSRLIRWIAVVVPPGERARTRKLIRRYRITKALPPCAGANSRSASVAKGLMQLPVDARWVLVHDGARPCVTVGLIDRCIRSMRRHKAVACGLPASLTVKCANGSCNVEATLDRRPLWFIQTPQGFSRGLFEESLRRFGNRLNGFPDDAAILEKAGSRVRLIAGEPLNLKVTTREDLMLARAIIRHRRTRLL